MKRINAFDIIRGIAVIFLIILHTGLHTWSEASAIEGGAQESDPFLNVLVFFLTLGGIFYTIMGTVNSYMFYNRIKSGKNTTKQIGKGGLILGLCLIFLHYFFRFLVSADSGILFHLIGDQEFIIPAANWIIGSSTLPMLGYNSIIIGYVVPNLIKNKTTNEANLNRVYLIIGGTALFIILIALPLRVWLGPLTQELIDDRKYLLAWLLAPFVYDNFPIFPMAGFGLFGCILGLMLAKEEKPKKILVYISVQMILWLFVGLLGIQLRGGIDPNLVTLNTVPGMYEDFFRHLGQLGICFLFFFLALIIFDFLPEKYDYDMMKYFGWLRRLGLVSLTAYIFEGLFAVIIRELINLIPATQGWNDSLVNVIIFGAILATIWGIATFFWEKKGFKWSVEWCIIQLIEKLSGKKSQKYDIKREESQNEPISPHP